MWAYSLIDKNISDEKLKKFIEYLLTGSDYFSLSFHNTETEEGSISEELEQYRLKTFRTNSWYCYKTVENNSFKVSIFKSDVVLIDIIMKMFNKLFPDEIVYGEDICFFDKKEILFGSVSHENQAQLFISEERMEIMKKIAEWEGKYLSVRDYDYIPSIEKVMNR